MSERTDKEEAKKQLTKDLIQQLHAGVSPVEVKGKFTGVSRLPGGYPGYNRPKED